MIFQNVQSAGLRGARPARCQRLQKYSRRMRLNMKKQMLREIRNGVNLEQNLPVLFNEMASVNHVFAGTSFAMQYYSLYAALADGDKSLNGELVSILQEISAIVRKNILDSFDGEVRENSIERLDAIRELITARMQVLTAYTDRFGLYEYILNRQEPSFEKGLTDADNDTIAREILRYIFMEKDNAVINNRIHQMLSQLPIRMSKGRFIDLIKAGMELYLGSDRSTVEDFIYRVESIAGLYQPEGIMEYFPELAANEAELKAVDFSLLDEAGFARCMEIMSQTTARLTEQTDCFYEMMEIVNSLYAWLLNLPYASMEAFQLTDAFTGILEAVTAQLEKIIQKEKAMSIQGLIPLSEELISDFEKSEGILESCSLQLQSQQSLLDELKEELKKNESILTLKQQLHCLERSSNLLGDSLFVELNQTEAAEQKADREYLNQAENTLCEKLLTALKEQPQMKNRAMIAAVFSELPVFFNDQKEVMDYVRTSLAGCHDLAEKTASVRLIRRLMEEG